MKPSMHPYNMVEVSLHVLYTILLFYTGLGGGKPVWNTATYPEVGEWHHVVAVFHQGAPSHFYLNGVKVPISPTGSNSDGQPDLYIGGTVVHGHEHRIDGCLGQRCQSVRPRIGRR